MVTIGQEPFPDVVETPIQEYGIKDVERDLNTKMYWDGTVVTDNGTPLRKPKVEGVTLGEENKIYDPRLSKDPLVRRLANESGYNGVIYVAPENRIVSNPLPVVEEVKTVKEEPVVEKVDVEKVVYENTIKGSYTGDILGTMVLASLAVAVKLVSSRLRDSEGVLRATLNTGFDSVSTDTYRGIANKIFASSGFKSIVVDDLTEEDYTVYKTVLELKAKVDKDLVRAKAEANVTGDYSKVNELIATGTKCDSELESMKIINKDGKLAKITTGYESDVASFFDIKIVNNDLKGDIDSNKWNTIKYVFTNVNPEEHVFHTLDRRNRPSMVYPKYEFTDAIKTLFNGSVDEKGIFIVTRNVFGRPNLTNTGLDNDGKPMEDLEKLFNEAVAIANSNTPMECYKPLINNNGVIPNVHSYLSGYDTNIDSYADAYIRFIEKYKLGMNFGTCNLFNSGIDSSILNKKLQYSPDKANIKLWKELVYSHSKKDDMLLNITTGDKILTREDYNNFLMSYTGNVSNFVIKKNPTEEELRLSSFKLSEGNIELSLGNQGIISKFITGKNYEYGNYLLAGCLDPNLIVSTWTRDNYEKHFCNGYRYNLEENRARTATQLLRANGIQAEDIVFIPLSKLEEKNSYYDQETDTFIVLNDKMPSVNASHPYNVVNRNRVDLDTGASSSTGFSILIETTESEYLGRTYYTKVFGNVHPIPVCKSKTGRSAIVVAIKGSTDNSFEEKVYPLTDSKLEELGIYSKPIEAISNGLDDKTIAIKKFDTDYHRADTEYEKSKNDLKKSYIDCLKLTLDQQKAIQDCIASSIKQVYSIELEKIKHVNDKAKALRESNSLGADLLKSLASGLSSLVSLWNLAKGF